MLRDVNAIKEDEKDQTLALSTASRKGEPSPNAATI